MLDGKKPSDVQEYYDLQTGIVSHCLDKTYGVIEFKQGKALFMLSDLWLSSTSTANAPGQTMSVMAPRGTEVKYRSTHPSTQFFTLFAIISSRILSF